MLLLDKPKAELMIGEIPILIQRPIVDSPFDVWMDIMTGKADGQRMLMQRKYKVDGDLSLMIQLFQRGNEQ